MMNDDQLIIWAAGFFDGEGCAAICRQAHSQSKRLQYQLQVSICQKDENPLRIFHFLFGGSLYPYKMKGVEYWRWCASNNHAMRMLEALRPFLILKQDRADICIDFQKKLVVWNRDFGRRGYPEHVHAAREEFFQRMKALNQRGVADDNPNPKKTGPKKGAHKPSAFKRYNAAQKSKEKESQVTVQ